METNNRGSHTDNTLRFNRTILGWKLEDGGKAYLCEIALIEPSWDGNLANGSVVVVMPNGFNRTILGWKQAEMCRVATTGVVL